MTPEQKTQLVKRLKSFVWRASMMALAVFFSTLSASVADLQLPAWATLALGLGLGEISKYLNTKVL